MDQAITEYLQRINCIVVALADSSRPQKLAEMAPILNTEVCFDAYIYFLFCILTVGYRFSYHKLPLNPLPILLTIAIVLS